MFTRKNKPEQPEGQGGASVPPPQAGSGTPALEPKNLGPDDTGALIDQLTAERDAADHKWKHALADFQNFQRRSLQSEQEARRQGVTAVLHSIIPVLDNFDLALNQASANPGASSILDGIQVIRGQLLRALEVHGISLINPEPGADFDPKQHEAIMHEPAQGLGPGRIARTLQVGYLLGERVIRPAKVAVTPEEPSPP